LFLQKEWVIIDDDMYAAVLAILNGHSIPLTPNLTFVTLNFQEA